MRIGKRIRVISILIVAMLMNTACLSSVFASNGFLEQESVVIMDGNEIVPFADSIVKKYRIYNGVRQYRRWNETKKYWVDPYWINIS